MNDKLKLAQQKYEKTEAARERQARYRKSEIGRTTTRKCADMMSAEQRERRREAKRLSAQRCRAKAKEEGKPSPQQTLRQILLGDK